MTETKTKTSTYSKFICDYAMCGRLLPAIAIPIQLLVGGERPYHFCDLNCLAKWLEYRAMVVTSKE